jgi:hypothetical protein
MAALMDEAVASMGATEENVGLAPAFLCAAITDAAMAGTLNYKCNLIALPTLAGWRRS